VDSLLGGASRLRSKCGVQEMLLCHVTLCPIIAFFVIRPNHDGFRCLGSLAGSATGRTPKPMHWPNHYRQDLPRWPDLRRQLDLLLLQSPAKPITPKPTDLLLNKHQNPRTDRICYRSDMLSLFFQNLFWLLKYQLFKC